MAARANEEEWAAPLPDEPTQGNPADGPGLRALFPGPVVGADGCDGEGGPAAVERLAALGTTVQVHAARRELLMRLPSGCEVSASQLRVALCWMMGQLPGVRVRLKRAAPASGFAAGRVPSEDVVADYLQCAVLLACMDDPAARGMWMSSSFARADGAVRLYIQSALELAREKQWHVAVADWLQALCGVAVPLELTRHAGRDDVVHAFRQRILEEAVDAGARQLAEAQSQASAASDAPTAKPVQAGRKQGARNGYGEDERRQPGRARPPLPPIPIHDIQDELREATVIGRVFGLELRELPSKRQLLQFHITDDGDSITCKAFLRGGRREAQWPHVADGQYLRVVGSVQFDAYLKELILLIADMTVAEAPTVTDAAPDKRVELHAHTQMSAQDGVVSAGDLVARAAQYGHAAVAVTDHGVVQSYPEAYAAGKRHGIKILYGLEANVVDVSQTIVSRPGDAALDAGTTYVVFDAETTGLSAAENELIEIAGVKMRGGEVLETFAELILPSRPIDAKITEITNITNNMVAGKPGVAEVLPRFRAFCGDAVLVAHNAEFDMSFLDATCAKLGEERFMAPVIDTLALARALFPNDRNHRLKTLAQKFDVKLVNHHRALADSEATGRVLYRLLEEAVSRHSLTTLRELADLGRLHSDFTRNRPFHATVLVAARAGLKNMYKLVSRSHLDYFYREPRIPRDVLVEHRAGLLVGSGCKFGEVFQALLRGRPDDEMRKMMKFYDFIELQPIDHFEPLTASGELPDTGVVRDYHLRLLRLADDLGIPVVATGDVHFLSEQDAVFREIILSAQGANRDAKQPVRQPQLTLRTTDEMLEAFAHLGARAREVVIDNPRRIADGIEAISPLPDRVYPPIMEGAEEQVRSLSTERAEELYGVPLPEVVSQRLEKELNSIITHGFSVNYLIAHKLVTKSLSDGYIVGSRGSVGSSLVATLMDITEVNPLAPHYLCRACRHSEFILDGSIGSGFDLPDKSCPQCEQPMRKDGQDIPFETFLGFDGDKVPDIDLNFSGEYQARAHKYTEELFGSEYVFRAGTISTIAEKTAFGYVKKWADDRGLLLRNAEIARLVGGCTGIKRTTGQHPGGLIIVPNDHEIYDFCPVQHPADDKSSGTRTTHFDFESIHDNLLKLDILGHDDPTMLRMLQDITGVPVQSVPLDDPKVYSLFSGTDVLGVTPEELRSTTGTYGIPEYGTKFVRKMLEDTQPTTFADLVRISGLSHGTDVWLNNAQELIQSGVAVLRDVICCRDDIMVYLIYQGLEPKRAFSIMEAVRKGRGLKDDDITYMASFGVPDWYMESCRRIKYMFPKAHAAAYVLNAVRIAWFKVHEPLAYYAAYFTVRAADFDLDLMMQGADAIDARIQAIDAEGNAASVKDKSLRTVLEVALEMTRRRFHFNRLDLYRSDATRFLIDGDGLTPPFAAASGIGEAAAGSLVAARESAEFISVEDIQERARVSRAVTEVLDRFGCLEGLPPSNQLSLF